MLSIAYYKYNFQIPNAMLGFFGAPSEHDYDENEYVAAKIIERMRQTPLPTMNYNVSAETGRKLSFLCNANMHCFGKISTGSDEKLSTVVLDEIVYAPKYIDDCAAGIGGEMYFNHLPTRSMILFDSEIPTTIKTNGIKTRDFIDLLCWQASFMVEQAKSDHELVESGKITWQQISDMEDGKYTDEGIRDGCHRTGFLRLPFVLWE